MGNWKIENGCCLCPYNSFHFSFDYLRITNEHNDDFGEHCGKKTGQTVLVTGEYAILMFHSDTSFQRTGFLLFFTAIPQSKYKRLPIVKYKLRNAC